MISITNSQLSSNRLLRLEKNYIPFSFCLKVLMFLNVVLLFSKRAGLQQGYIKSRFDFRLAWD